MSMSSPSPVGGELLVARGAALGKKAQYLPDFGGIFAPQGSKNDDKIL